jgi:hypothetical protein
MIIKHIDGTEVDTDKLPDIDAQIIEKTEELRRLCESSNRIFLLHIDTRGNKKLTSFWNLKNGSNPNPEMMNESFRCLANHTHKYFMMTTSDSLGVYPTSAIDPDYLNNNNNNLNDE